MELILRLGELLVRLLVPARGWHRTVPEQGDPAPRARRRTVVCRTAVDFQPGYFPALRATGGALVRTQAQIAYELAEQAEARLRRQRRRALWLAAYGIDAGPRVMQIHGMAVTR
ncbi:hypothetical protein GCM10010329_08270 [Streptomyces spiroverticillatus]|uniref:Uncharacterized protein n=1 Tax=Streptomyces finlayi TaxID=67296 RepID=A0A918WT60_9ACTN|nr:hypothetical protein [Streptomyces finlayi]GGZ90085.1 hypothetical protein GCM10010329_08270 [Streptomyces spiroverticillatus]GHC80887.1 hypothetical protein GCM10010334_08260 [Streptomyces finlayi]